MAKNSEIDKTNRKMGKARAEEELYICICNQHKMKKIANLLLVFSALSSLSCEKGEPVTPETDATTGASIPSDENENNDNGTAGDGKNLIVFFSRAGENWQVGTVEKGNTAVMVDYMVEATEADVFEIVPETAYPQAYNETLTVATNEKNGNARPEFKGGIENLDQYENVFIGGPIWWGEPPMILHTFCEAYPALKDKTLIPFGTHGGSGVGSYKTMLQKYYPSAKYLESLGISGASVRDAASKTAVENWVKKLGLEKK